MTREEAKHRRLFTQWQEETHFVTWETTTSEIIQDHDAIINEIYDDFESRTCENCKRYVPMKWTDFDNKCASMENKVSHVDKDFGCNKFERKEE